MNLRLPTLHSGQLEIFESEARNRVVICGRRWGKTYLGCAEAIRACLQAKQVWWLAPTHAVSSLAWEQLKLLFTPLVKLGLAEIQESKKRIVSLGGSITCKSAELYDNLRGAGLDLAIFDEADFIEHQAWAEAIRPTLSDRRGRALFLTTPNPRLRNSWIQKLYQRGQMASANWRSFSRPSWTNPFLSPSEIEDARLDLPSVTFRTEYGAEFVSEDGAKIKEQWLQTTQAIPPSGLDIAIGVDLAISLSQDADYTAVVALGRSKDGRLYVLGASRGRMPFDEILRFIKSFAERYKARIVGVENVQFQAAVVQELLRNTSLPVVGIRADKDKLTRFLPVAARYEQRLIYHAQNLPNEFLDELLSFPEVKHDDFVDALSTAYQALNFIAFSSVHASSGNKRGHLSGFIR
jgi:predicted phage terminase large subunit-like protein